MRTELLAPAQEPAWERFVAEHPDGTFFHGLAWRDVIQRRIGHRPLYLVARDGAAIAGVLPLFLVGSPLLGRVLVSVPYGVYGGIVAREPAAEQSLLERAAELRAAAGAGHVELRCLHRPGFVLPETSLYHTFIGDLPATPEACLDVIPRKSRATTRHARDRHGLVFEGGAHLLDGFYELFAANKRSLGSPVFDRAFFRAILERCGAAACVHGVRHEGRLIAAVLSFVHDRTFMPYYSGAVPGTERLGSMNFMYWQLMEEGVRRGLRRFDFGRSRAGTGAFQFKVNMGFEPRPLHYQYVLAEGREIPSVNPSNPRYAGVRAAWARLPLAVVKRIGPVLMRFLP